MIYYPSHTPISPQMYKTKTCNRKLRFYSFIFTFVMQPNYCKLGLNGIKKILLIIML